MRKKKLKKVSLAVTLVTLSALVALALLRTFVFHPTEWYAVEGGKLFVQKGCSNCHHADSTDTLVGPGLKGLFQRDRLPVSGRQVTEANVRRQLTDPFENMPSYREDLSDDDMMLLVDYLKTL